MTKCISSARTDKKESTPISKELVVPIEKRSKLIGVGGINIRRITSNTGKVF
jgi:polyribonucleotide nucleotidyltransferase